MTQDSAMHFNLPVPSPPHHHFFNGTALKKTINQPTLSLFHVSVLILLYFVQITLNSKYLLALFQQFVEHFFTLLGQLLNVFIEQFFLLITVKQFCQIPPMILTQLLPCVSPRCVIISDLKYKNFLLMLCFYSYFRGLLVLQICVHVISPQYVDIYQIQDRCTRGGRGKNLLLKVFKISLTRCRVAGICDYRAFSVSMKSNYYGEKCEAKIRPFLTRYIWNGICLLPTASILLFLLTRSAKRALKC